MFPSRPARLLSLFVVVGALLPGAATAGSPRARVQRDVVGTVAATGRAPVLVLLGDAGPETASDTVRAASVAALQHAVTRAVPTFRVTRTYGLVPALGGELDAAALAQLARHPNVKVIELAREEVAMIEEHVAVVKGRQVQTGYGFTGEGVTVAVLDTGIDTDHPDLADDIVAQQCYSQAGGCAPNNSTQGPSAEDEGGHGTSVSSIITSAGNQAAVGIAPDAGIAAIRVFNDRSTADTRDIVAGLDWALSNRRKFNIKVVNMSLGSTNVFPGNCDSEDATRASAVSSLVAQGISVFVASGNGGANNGMSAPGCLAKVISVGASYDDEFARAPAQGQFGPGCFDEHTTTTMVACFSNVSRTLDLVAPGIWTTSSAMGGGTSTSAGTSNASPLAAGVAALVYELNPNIRPTQLERLLTDTGDEAVHPATGLKFSRVNALAAIESIVPVTHTPQPSPTGFLTPTNTATPIGNTATPTGQVTGGATTAVPSRTPSFTPTAPTVGPESGTIYLPIARSKRAR